MAYHKPNILDPSVPGGDSVREAIDKNDANVDYTIDSLNQHNHEGGNGAPISPGSLPDTIAYLTGANFTGDVQGPKIWAREALGTLGVFRYYDKDNQAVYAEGELSAGSIRYTQMDGSGEIGGLKLRINDEEVPTSSFFTDVSAGPDDGGRGVKLNASGKVDESMLEIGGLVFIGSWTPTAGAEYPDTTGVEPGSFWMVSGVDDVNGYTFTGGDLSGQTAYNSDTMLWGSDSWMLKTVSVDPDMYYRLDGVSPITANFQSGGHRLVNVAEPQDDTDAATKYYVDQHEGGGGGINPINDPQPGDFARFLDPMSLEGVSHAELEDSLDFYKTGEFIHLTLGTADAFKPIQTSQTGYIDKSLLDITVFYFVGSFTPTASSEYPDTTSEEPGAFWDVEGTHVDDGYTFTGGDLVGQTAHNGDLMMYGSGGWALRQSSLDPEMYYRLDGANALIAPFAGGGQQLKIIADGSDDTDAITKRQLDNHDHAGAYLPITGTAANSALLENHPASYFATATHNHDSTYARLDGATFTGDVTVNANFSVSGSAFFDYIPSTDGSPTNDNDLVTKGYVDSAFARLDGATFTGDVVAGANFSVSGSAFFDYIPATNGYPAYDNDLATKSYVDASGGSSWEDIRIMELGINVPGDEACRIDFHSSSTVSDYDFTIARNSGANGRANLYNVGAGGIEIYTEGGNINLTSYSGVVYANSSRVWTDDYNDGGGSCDGCAMLADTNSFTNTNYFRQEIIRDFPDSDNGFVVYQASYNNHGVYCGVADGNYGWEGYCSSVTGTPPYTDSAPLYFVGNLLPEDPNIYDIGSSSLHWNTIYVNNTLMLADAARMYSQAGVSSIFSGLVYDLNPVEFELIDQGVTGSAFLADVPPQQTGRKHIGILAQEVEDALTSRGLSASEFFLTDGEAGNKSVNLTALIPLLINEIKVLETRITNLGG